MIELDEKDKFENLQIMLRNKSEMYNNIDKLLSKLNNYVDNVKVLERECRFAIPHVLQIKHNVKSNKYITCDFYYDKGVASLIIWNDISDIYGIGRKFDIRCLNQLTALYNVIINYIIYGDDNIMDDRLIVDGKRIDYISSGEII